MTREQKTEIWAEIVAMPEKTKVEKLRKANAIRHFENADNDSGAYGRIREILSKSAHSKQVNFAKQGKADCFVWVDGKRYAAECKTNGGRIGSLYGKNAPQFVVYSMDICNAGTSNIRREIKQVVMKTTMFIAIVEGCGAVKNTNGKQPEPAIQVTSKKLFEALERYTLRYDPNRRYSEMDF